MSPQAPAPAPAPSGLRQSVAALGAGAFMVVCCLVMPTLVAAGVLGAVGGFLQNSMMLVLALLLAALALTTLARRRARGSAPGPPGRPAAPSDQSGG